MTEIHYGIAISEPLSGRMCHENSRALFETMSGIKSIIGSLALEQAAKSDHDIDAYTLSIGRAHSSNGSGELKRQLRADGYVPPMSLRDVIGLSIADSDCVATNALIDYLGDQDSVNQKIESTFRLPGVSLVTNKIDFPGVDHKKQPFQVGKGTMLDFVRYYEAIWSPISDWQSNSPHFAWYQDVHGLVQKARLFGIPQKDLPEEAAWYHKTGSAVDVKPDSFYMASMDAGMLKVANRTIFIAAANTVLQDGQHSDESMVEQDFAMRNELALQSMGLALPSRESVDSF